MKLLGLDYGKKRLGVAISDETGVFALPHSVLQNDGSEIQKIMEIAKKFLVTVVVLGESNDYSGKKNEIQNDIEIFKNKIESAGLKVVYELEFMTSMHAERLQGKNDMTDASAAALILQSYLDRSKPHNE